MTEIILNAIMVGVFLTIAVEIPIFLFLYWFWNYGKRRLANELEYDNLYAKIKSDINDWPCTLENCLRLYLELIELKRLKYKNIEKTGILKQEFDWHYWSLNAKERTELKKAI